MAETAAYTIEGDGGAKRARLTGDWTAINLGAAPQRLSAELGGARDVTVDLSDVGHCDTSGVWSVLRATGAKADSDKIVASPELKKLFALVERATEAEPTPQVRRRTLQAFFARLGRGVVDIGVNIFDTMVFNGHLLVAIGRMVVNPRRIRWPAVFALAERAGLDAIPIVAVTTFFIGAVVGLLGANLLSKFGAQVFAVELIGIAILREFNVLIVALLLAGRSASSFAAEIGAMKMNQEIDAMSVLGIDAFDALVFPRFLALLATIPLLVFIATLAGLAGGLVVSITVLGLSPAAFYERLVDNVGITHFWIGMSKAPVMAVVVAGIGCRQGMAVGGDVESLGRRVTSAVVQAIFAAILIDAIFALIYMKLNV